MNRDIEDVKNNDAEEEVDSGVDGEGGHDSPAKDEEVEDDNVNKEVEEPEEDADYELIESVVFKGKMIRRQLSVQSHSKSVADLFSRVNSVDEANLSITGSRKVQQNKHFLTISLATIRLCLSFSRFQIDFIPTINILFTFCFVDNNLTSVTNLFFILANFSQTNYAFNYIHNTVISHTISAQTAARLAVVFITTIHPWQRAHS